MKRLVITGATGNLGSKLIDHFVSVDHVTEIVGLDLHPPRDQQVEQLRRQTGFEKVRFVVCDLGDSHDPRWRNEINGSDAVVHFAAKNPYPEASWDDSNTSLDMTLNVALASSDAGIGRFVFTSSNHVMGRYKDLPLAARIGPGELTTDLEHGVGTVWNTGNHHMDSTAYAVAKSSGERLCRGLALSAAARTNFICIRVGWCQPGENHPATLSAAGTPTQAVRRSEDAEAIATDQWFRNMWLSNRDFCQLFEKAIFADSTTWKEPCIVVNGTSANTGMKWSLTEAQRDLGYQPIDDVNQSLEPGQS